MKFMAAPGRFVRSEMKETRETRIETGGRTTRDLQKNIKKVQRLVTIRSFFFFFQVAAVFSSGHVDCFVTVADFYRFVDVGVFAPHGRHRIPRNTLKIETIDSLTCRGDRYISFRQFSYG